VLRLVISFTPALLCAASTRILSSPKPVQIVMPPAKLPPGAEKAMPAGAKPRRYISAFGSRRPSRPSAYAASRVIRAFVSATVEASSLTISVCVPVPPSMLSVPLRPSSVPVTNVALPPAGTLAPEPT
jgi:hypothetical protein